jgi:predicted RNase H-like nuclease (RuvC/YqgF family)
LPFFSRQEVLLTLHYENVFSGTNVNDKSQEILLLKEELLQHSTTNSAIEELNQIQKSLKSENDQLKKELEEVQAENSNLIQENEKFYHQVSDT